MSSLKISRGFWEIFLEQLNNEGQCSDFIEKVHDGSILDLYFKTSGGQIKLIYTTIMGLALLVFTVTGFWLWYGPKRMRAASQKHKTV